MSPLPASAVSMRSTGASRSRSRPAVSEPRSGAREHLGNDGEGLVHWGSFALRAALFRMTLLTFARPSTRCCCQGRRRLDACAGPGPHRSPFVIKERSLAARRLPALGLPLPILAAARLHGTSVGVSHLGSWLPKCRIQAGRWGGRPPLLWDVGFGHGAGRQGLRAAAPAFSVVLDRC